MLFLFKGGRDMRTVDLVVWVLFIGALVFLGYFFTKRVKKDNKKIRQQMQMEYFKEKRNIHI